MKLYQFKNTDSSTNVHIGIGKCRCIMYVCTWAWKDSDLIQHLSRVIEVVGILHNDQCLVRATNLKISPNGLICPVEYPFANQIVFIS